MANEPTTNDKVEEEVVLADPAQTPADEPAGVQPPADESEETPAEAATPEEPNEEEAIPEEKPPSHREQMRIQQLLQKYGDPRQPQQAPSQAQRNDALDYQTALDADPEVIRQLEADRQREGQAQYQAGAESTRAEIRTSEWRTLLNFDAPQTETKYPWLNPKDKENFEPALADAVNEEYKRLVGYDERTGLVDRPDIRYPDFVEARVELSTRLAKAMNAKTVENVAKQSAQTGLRPDGSSAKRLNLNQAPEDMSIDELYAKIGQKPPK
jgi:hypothetical protein